MIGCSGRERSGARCSKQPLAFDPEADVQPSAQLERADDLRGSPKTIIDRPRLKFHLTQGGQPPRRGRDPDPNYFMRESLLPLWQVARGCCLKSRNRSMTRLPETNSAAAPVAVEVASTVIQAQP